MSMKVYIKFLLHMLMKTKMNLFSKHEHENNFKFFSHNKLKFQPRS